MPHRFPIILALPVVGSVSSSSPVQETSSEFSCCDRSVSYSHDLSCDNTWRSDKMAIAEISDDTRSCESPCKEIEHDRMILDKCVNVTVDTVCAATGEIKETRVTYFAQMCPQPLTNGKPTGNQSSIGSLLLVVMTGRLLRFIS